MDRDLRTLWCGNLSSRVTEDILYELFLQAGPLDEVKIPKDRDSRPRPFGFITFKHDESVNYAMELFRGISLYNKELQVDRKVRLPPEQPVQRPDIYITNCTGPIMNGIGMIPYSLLGAYAPPYASHNQHYGGPINMYPSNNRRNNPRRHPYHRN